MWRQPFRDLLFGVDGALLAILTQTLKLDLAVNQRKEGIVGAHTNIGAGMDVRASLANQNIACQNELAIRAFYTQSLGLRITAVLGGAAALLMCKEL